MVSTADTPLYHGAAARKSEPSLCPPATPAPIPRVKGTDGWCSPARQLLGHVVHGSEDGADAVQGIGFAHHEQPVAGGDQGGAGRHHHLLASSHQDDVHTAWQPQLNDGAARERGAGRHRNLDQGPGDSLGGRRERQLAGNLRRRSIHPKLAGKPWQRRSLEQNRGEDHEENDVEDRVGVRQAGQEGVGPPG